MPTLTGSILHAPKSWQEFEDICLSSFILRWSNPNLCKHGRQGQEQNGVDIYGNDEKGRLVGVQCKNTLKTITDKLIDEECDKAEKFEPPLTSLYIATTSPTDAALQKYVRMLNIQRELNAKFPVYIVFWEGVQNDLCKDPAVLRQHYPENNGSVKPDLDVQKREKDIKLLREFMKIMDFPKVLNNIGFNAKYIHNFIIEQHEEFHSFKSKYSKSFYDIHLETAIDSLYNEWDVLLNLINSAPYDEDVFRPEQRAIFVQANSATRTFLEELLFKKVTDGLNNFKKSIQDFQIFLKDNYVEIDFN